MKSDRMVELEKCMNHTLELISNSANQSDKDYFKGEYLRLKGLYDEEVTSWIAIL